MNNPTVVGGRSVSDLAKRYRKHLLGIALTIVAYTLLGFFLAPWLVKNNAVRIVAESLHAELQIGKVAINPYVLSLRIDDMVLDGTAGTALASVKQVFINFQLSSLFRRAWTFDEFYIVGPELFLERNASGVLNLAGLAKESVQEPPVVAEQGESSPPRLLILDFAIRDSVVSWKDQVPVDPVQTLFGPVNIEISELNTLPQRVGQQAVVITTETQGTLSWSGSLELSPFHSTGRASIKGSHFPLTSAYMRHETGLDIVEGTADAGLDYSVVTEADGSLSASIENFDLAFSDVLVRTFHGAAEDNPDERDLFLLPRIELTGGALHWPEQAVSIESVSIDDSVVNLYRLPGGALDFGFANRTAATEDPVEEQVEGDPWSLSLGQLSVNEMSVALLDDSVQPSADVGIQSLNLSIRDISNAGGASFPTLLNVVPQTGGNISLEGTMIVLPDPVLDFELTIDNLTLAGAHPYLQPLADINLDSGALNLAAQLQSGTSEPLLLSGDLNITDFFITETDEGSRLGSWQIFTANGVVFSSANQSLEVSEILLQQPYADILIAEDGSVNLGRVQKGEAAGEAVEPDGEVAAAEDDIEAVRSPLAVTVGRVVIENGAADFADLSLPLPFDANIAELNGDLTTIATNSSEPSTVALEGKVDEFGFVRISGYITPLETSRNTDIKVAFQNVEMPKFSAYTIPFAGREIASGKLDLDLGYKVTESELVGENTIVLRDLELGDKVDHPGAMSLPLGLAVALLKDPEGKIDIDLPVRGNVDDPEFRYGDVVVKALGTLIVKIVASPFALLGNLLGVEASELEYIGFLPGRADLTPPEIERAGKLAEALAMRPVLVLELNGAVARERDGLALKTAKLDAVLEERIAAIDATDSDDSSFADQQLIVLEQIITETRSGVADSATLDTLRAQFTPQADEAEPQLDKLAYTSELRRILIDAQAVDDAELAALANGRSANTREAILQANPELEQQIIVGGPQAVEDDEGEEVRMKVTLGTGSENDE